MCKCTNKSIIMLSSDDLNDVDDRCASMDKDWLIQTTRQT